MLKLEFLADFRIYGREYTCVSDYGRQKPRAYLRGAFSFSHYRLKTWLEAADLGEFLIFLQKKTPIFIAADRLKIAKLFFGKSRAEKWVIFFCLHPISYVT